MKIIISIFFVCLVVSAKATNYTWSSGSTNINITNATFGTLNGGDTVFIPFRSGGYRSFSFSGLNSGADGSYIYIWWAATAYITPSSSALLANTIDNCRGVYVRGFKMDDHVDAAMREGGTGYNRWIYWDSCHFRGMPGFGPVANGGLSAFAGDTTKMRHHWRWHKCLFDSVYTGTSGGIALGIGGNAAGTITTNGYWRDVVVDSSYFGNYSSASPNTSNFIRIFEAFNIEVYGCTFENLGVVANPTGHAALIVTIASKWSVHDNFFGPDNFGNEIRDLGPCDLPVAGANYLGRCEFYNNLIFDKRKYPVYETRTVDGGTLSTLSPYVRSRTMGYCYNNTAYALSVGVGNGPYETNMVDCYANDTVFVKNCVVTVCRDTTWGTVFGPFMWSAANGTITTKDTASNRLVQLWVNSGLSDSVRYIPKRPGTLWNLGVAVPSFITTDIYGSPRPTLGRNAGTGVDIGAAQLFFPYIPVPYGSRIKFQ